MIGIFDSGSGGLTVMKEVVARLPQADFVYFGDLRNSPYGEKTPEELGALTVLGMQRLLSEGATQIVSACNSVSSNIVMPMFDILDIKPINIVEMVGPTVRAFRERRNAKILLVGPTATIRSGIYQNGFLALGMDIVAMPIPYLAGAIEEGTTEAGMRGMIANVLEKHNGKFDTLILACTHYPLVLDIFRDVTGDDVEIFNPARVVAEEVAVRFNEEGKGKLSFVISKESPFFRRKVGEIFGSDGYTVGVLS
jgi:glutamate racemase